MTVTGKVQKFRMREIAVAEHAGWILANPKRQRRGGFVNVVGLPIAPRR
jgi:hypothetical protein